LGRQQFGRVRSNSDGRGPIQDLSQLETWAIPYAGIFFLTNSAAVNVNNSGGEESVYNRPPKQIRLSSVLTMINGSAVAR